MQVSYHYKDHEAVGPQTADLLRPNLLQGRGLKCPSYLEAANHG